MNNNTYIKIFEFGEKNLKGFNYKKINDEIENLEDWEKEIIKENIDNAYYNRNYIGAPGYSKKESFFYCIKFSGAKSYDDERNKFMLNSESYFNYLDYLELKEARLTAKQALITSIIAIGIAIITFISSIIFSIIKINS